MEPEKTIPITIVTGFLGAGKTSLINHLLQNDCYHCQAVLVNDFGAEKLDTRLIAPDGMIQLMHGCICCSSRHAMQTTLGKMSAAKPARDRILIEASGVADPCAIVTALEIPELKTRVKVKEIITVVAANQVLALRGDMAQLAKMQLACANLVIVNKSDLVSEVQLNSIFGWLHALKIDVPIKLVTHGHLADNEHFENNVSNIVQTK